MLFRMLIMNGKTMVIFTQGRIVISWRSCREGVVVESWLTVEGLKGDSGISNWGFVGLYDSLMCFYCLELVYVVEEKLREKRKIWEK